MFGTGREQSIEISKESGGRRRRPIGGQQFWGQSGIIEEKLAVLVDESRALDKAQIVRQIYRRLSRPAKSFEAGGELRQECLVVPA